DTIIHGGEQSLLARMIAAHLEHEATATIATERLPPERISRYGVLEPEGPAGEIFRVRSVVEKPAPEAAPRDQAISGRYIFTAEIFAACRAVGPGKSGEIELTAAMSWLAQSGKPVIAVNLERGQRRLDIGNPESYFAAFARFAAKGGDWAMG